MKSFNYCLNRDCFHSSLLLLLFFISSALLLLCVHCRDSPPSKSPVLSKKDIRDYSDADMERLYDQWEEGEEEELPEDELPEHLRRESGMRMELSSEDLSNPENLLKMSKKGKTLMSFVTVGGGGDGDVVVSRDETERVTALWQTSLRNSHIIAERFLIGDNRAIFMFKDGAQAWEAKDFLVEQDLCEEVTIENKPYYGKRSGKKKLSPDYKQEL